LDKGVLIEVNGRRIHLDGGKGDINFISHAHTDHLIKKNGRVICSDETKELAKIRIGVDFEIEQHPKLRMINAGHVLGSKALIIDDEKKIVYTGDFCLKKRNFLEGFKPEKCDILIIESTFANPDYAFPEINEIKKELKDYIEDNHEYNINLLGYSLGKAQQICQIIKDLKIPAFVDPTIKKINDVHKKFGVNINQKIFTKETKEPFVLISPFNKRIKNAKKVGFSGWAVNPEYKYRLGLDKAFPLSDHADFYDIIKCVKKSEPETIFTYHGFSEELARFLKLEGFNAIPLQKKQTILNNFI